MEKKPQISVNRQLLLLLALIFGARLFASVLFVLIRPLFGGFDPDNFDGLDLISGYVSGFVMPIGFVVVSYLLFMRATQLKASKTIDLQKWTSVNLAKVLGILVVGMFIVSGLTMLNTYLIDLYPQSGFHEMMEEQNAHHRMLFNPARVELFPVALIAFALLPAIAEELVFRGLLMKKLYEVSSGNKHFAVIVSALIFAAMHMQPWYLLPMTAMGMLFGYVYLHFKDIRYPMLMHFLFNAIQITIAFFFADQPTV